MFSYRYLVIEVVITGFYTCLLYFSIFVKPF